MICNACGQNEATIHLTEILNNQMVEVHLCESCAEQKGSDFTAQFDFNKLLTSLTDFSIETKKSRSGALSCKSCGMTYEEFGRTGRLGCERCYHSFGKILMPLMRRVQREVQHAGKVPSKTAGEVTQRLKLKELQTQLRKCIQSESFEEAAAVRDKIRELEEKAKKPAKKPRNSQDK